ncbi:MAG: YwiC-like family protein [Phormidesmis sp.]
MTSKPIKGVPAFPPKSSPHKKPWYQPTFSPEHGVLIMLLGAALTGASLAQTWTTETTWACLTAYLAVQAEHPIVVQIKQRRQWRPRYLVWAGIYGISATAIALYLCFQHPALLWICLAGIFALVVDTIAVFQHNHKSIANEITMFVSICLTTLFVYSATTGTITLQAIGLWLMNSLFFSSAVFSVKLRKSKTSSLKSGAIYHVVATVLVALLYIVALPDGIHWISLFTALAFAIAPLKFAVIAWQRNWYRTCQFGHIARFETYFALLYIALVSLTVLPPKLPHA